MIKAFTVVSMFVPDLLRLVDRLADFLADFLDADFLRFFAMLSLPGDRVTNHPPQVPEYRKNA